MDILGSIFLSVMVTFMLFGVWMLYCNDKTAKLMLKWAFRVHDFCMKEIETRHENDLNSQYVDLIESRYNALPDYNTVLWTMARGGNVDKCFDKVRETLK